MPSRPVPRPGRHRRADAVVADPQPDRSAVRPELDPGARRLRVPGDVGQRLLRDPVGGEHVDLVEAELGVDPDLDLDPLLAQRRGQQLVDVRQPGRRGDGSGDSGSRRCTTSASSSPRAVRPSPPMSRSAPSGSAICPASACTTIAVTWWPTTSCSSRARLVRCSSQAAWPRSTFASPESWSVRSRARSRSPEAAAEGDTEERDEGRAALAVDADDERQHGPEHAARPSRPTGPAQVLGDGDEDERRRRRARGARVSTLVNVATNAAPTASTVDRQRWLGREATMATGIANAASAPYPPVSSVRVLTSEMTAAAPPAAYITRRSRSGSSTRRRRALLMSSVWSPERRDVVARRRSRYPGTGRLRDRGPGPPGRRHRSAFWKPRRGTPSMT